MKTLWVEFKRHWLDWLISHHDPMSPYLIELMLKRKKLEDGHVRRSNESNTLFR